MFENESKKSFLPGYTGYVPQFVPEKYTGPIEAPKKHIPGIFLRSLQIFLTEIKIGYQGFVAAVKSENMFGETFGKITQKSGYGQVCKGREVPPAERYKTVTMEHHKHPQAMVAPTVAATVGVEKAPEVFEKVFFLPHARIRTKNSQLIQRRCKSSGDWIQKLTQ